MQLHSIDRRGILAALALALGACSGGGSGGGGTPPATHAISGTVGGAVSAGVTLTLSGATSATTVSGVTGAYSFTGLADGSYTVAPARSGYAFTPSTLAVVLSGADATGRDFSAAAMLSVDGGTASDGAGAAVQVPFGALDGPTAVSVAATALPPPAGVAALSPVYAFGPSGAVFARPVKVSLPLPAGVNAASIYWSRPDGSGFDAIGGDLDLSARTISAQVSHFSQAVLGPAVATRAVTGTALVTYISATTRASLPRSLTGTPEALVDDGAGGLTTVPGVLGTGAAAGTFTIPGVPVGEYLLHHGKTWLVTSSSAPDLGTNAPGKLPAERTTAATGTRLDLTVTGMAPWQAGDQLELFCSQADDADFGSQSWSDPALVGGETTAFLPFSVPELNGSSSGVPALIEYSKGDEAFLVQLSTGTSPGGATYQALSRAARLPAFDLVPGGTTAVAASMVDVSNAHSLSLDLRGKAWASALAQDGHPAGVAACQAPPSSVRCVSVFGLLGHPGRVEDGEYGATPDLLLLEDPDVVGGTDVVTGAMGYGDLTAVSPSGTWGVTAVANWSHGVPLKLPGTLGAGFSQVANHIGWITTPGALAAGPVLPPIAAPTAASVAGRPLFDGGTGVGLTPALAWSPPRSGSPAHYRLDVFELSASKTNLTALALVASFLTPHTSLTLPAGILVAGKSYAFSLEAVAGTSAAGVQQLAVSPLRPGLDVAFAGVASGIFTP